MSNSRLSFAIGTLLSLTGIIIPPSALIGFLRGTPPVDLHEQLLLGAMLFKIGLVIIGIYTIMIFRIPTWKTNLERRKSFPNNLHDSKITSTFLALILSAAFALRLYGLNSGLWCDEIYTFINYVKIPLGEIVSTYGDQNQHILYSLLSHITIRIFGESAWSLRLPAVLFGTGSIWALYLLGREVFSSREALFSAALLAFSYHHIWFSQNARGYTGLLFWTILCSWLFLRGIHEGRLHLWVLYAITVALGAYTLMYMLFVVIGHFIAFIITILIRRKDFWTNRWAGFFIGFCFAGLFTFQLYALLLPQVFTAFSDAEVVGKAWTQPIWAMLEFVRGMQINFSGSTVVIAALLVFVVGLLSLARTNPVVLLMFSIPVIICTVVKFGMGHHLWPRSYFFAVGFGALVVVSGTMKLGHMADRLLQFGANKLAVVGTILCSGMIFVLAISAPSAYGPKQDYLGALNFVETNKKPGDSVVTIGITTEAFKCFYKMDWEAIETLEHLNSIRSRAKRTWLLYTIPIHLEDEYPEIMASIHSDFKVVKKFYGTLRGGTIFICRIDSPFS